MDPKMSPFLAGGRQLSPPRSHSEVKNGPKRPFLDWARRLAPPRVIWGQNDPKWAIFGVGPAA